MGNRAGIDWALEKHDVLIADEADEELLAATFAHDERGRGRPALSQFLAERRSIRPALPAAIVVRSSQAEASGAERLGCTPGSVRQPSLRP
ncbi:MAG: hypothetical protein WBP81_11050 [Solirubrobacteraceae bacterium]